MNVADRLRADAVPVGEDGLHFRPHGRSAVIWIVEGGRALPVECDMPGTDDYDILVYGELDHLASWRYPAQAPIPVPARRALQAQLIAWLESRGWRHDIVVRPEAAE